MTQPMDPANIKDLEGGEYSYGMGLFPPGVAANEGQSQYQDDFGANMRPAVYADGESLADNYARAVADRRTDPCDAASSRDFETLGNCDRFGAGPPLVRAKPVSNSSPYEQVEFNKTPRRA